jgi:hypothetical protein
MREDPIVAEVRRIREELAARFGFDVKAIFADLRSRQAALGERLVSRQTVPGTTNDAIGDRSSGTSSDVASTRGSGD